MRDPRTVAADLVRELLGAFSNRLRGALLYGSVPRGEYIDGVSNVNVLVLLDDIDPATLRQASPLARRWAAVGLAPLILEVDEWARAADVFAIEILDMKAAHEMLHGIDPLDGVEVSRDALRLQAERELRAKLIALHTGMLQAADAPDALGDLLMVALPSFATYLRAALRLAGRDVPSDTGAVVQAAGELVGFDGAGLRAALDARRARRKWKVSMSDAALEQYHAAAERTAMFVDRIGR
jgi:hypothetical protein